MEIVRLGIVTAPGANNLAGIVVDQEKKLVYTTDRSTSRLYVYDWNSIAKILTLKQQLNLPGVSQIYGLALDESKDWLFMADANSNTIRYFNTSDWSLAGSFSVSQKPMGIAVDAKNQLVYTGNAYPPYGGLDCLVKYDLNTSTESWIDVRSLPGGNSSDNAVGLAVDPESSLLYITTGNQGSGGSDRIIVFNSALTMLYATGDIGDPTGLCVPGKQISFNPLRLAKQDDVANGQCAFINGPVTYTIGYNNSANAIPVHNVIIKDTLPPEAQFLSATGGGLYDAATHTVKWDIGFVPAGSPGATFQLSVLVTTAASPGGTIANYATITSTETGPTTVVEYTSICPCSLPIILRTLAGNRGYYKLTTDSDCFGGVDFFVRDSISGFIAGPFPSGTIVRIVRGIPGTGPGTGTASVTIRVSGVGLAYAVDPLGNTSSTLTCPP